MRCNPHFDYSSETRYSFTRSTIVRLRTVRRWQARAWW